MRLQRPLSPLMFVAGAHVLVGLGRQAGTACGTLVDDMRRAAGLAPGAEWDLAFIHHVGWHSQRMRAGPRSAWPFSRATSHAELAAVAQSHGLTVARPGEGDIVLYWSDSLRSHVHSGIVVGLSAESMDDAGHLTYTCVTIEVDKAAASPGGSVREHETSICPQRGDMLVRWTLSDARQARLDSRHRQAGPRGRESWEYDEQLGRCA